MEKNEGYDKAGGEDRGAIVDDTIAAISTAMTPAGIGIVRMSGREAFAIGDRLFQPASGKAYSQADNRKLRYGHILDGDQIVDEVLVSYMEGPHTYTAENIVEINTHGGLVALQRVLKLLLREGARLAQPGEFTRRAFLNGRMDLTQAEATLDIIEAKTEKAQALAEQQLAGSLSSKVHALKDQLLTLLAHIEYAINFMEDAQEDLPRQPMWEECEKLRQAIQGLLKNANRGRLLKEGIATVIVGKPNVGKSSLLNALLDMDRAIVTDIPGTTRDSIEETYRLDGILLRLIDTAGIRQTADQVEAMGVDRSRKLMDQADLVLVLLDGSQALEAEDLEILQAVEGKTAILLLNKEDLGLWPGNRESLAVYPFPCLSLSAKEGSGLDDLKETIRSLFFSESLLDNEEFLVSNLRHIQLLEQAESDLASAAQSFQDQVPLDALEVDIRSAYMKLAEITGEAVDDDVLNKIFSDFCIGK